MEKKVKLSDVIKMVENEKKYLETEQEKENEPIVIMGFGSCIATCDKLLTKLKAMDGE
jgi:hypothetical protein